jgi:hypothetical protein
MKDHVRSPGNVKIRGWISASSKSLTAKGAKGSAKDGKRVRKISVFFAVVKILFRGINADYIDVEAEVLVEARDA